MITQEKFDRAYQRIVELRDQVTVSRRAVWNQREFSSNAWECYGQEKGLSQALSILEEADR